ncbi:transaldolase family protein [Salinibacterium sp. G-O1]|uniref:transaldolase family protein n=1 Tax=Salinibacterium sp. G-O1 TaxID=3046208 RepID=UPI0024BA14C9|nr:transaldolase family protein [Salinibacterium sp. G-O1]MDJ0335724.1 transaldolase family protein [Salinibacterium sp. G-O1]
MDTTPRIYVDSADVTAVSELLATRLVFGVTTNPTILERGGQRLANLPSLYARWVDEGANEVFFQAWGTTAESMLHNAQTLAALGERVVVKVPATRDGFITTRALVARDVPVLITAVYSVAQALAGVAYGARYLAPYFGRLGDNGRDALGLITQMQKVCEGSATNVLAASLRSPDDIVALRLAGVRHFTAAPDVIFAALHDDISEQSAADFEAAVERISP